MEPALQAAVERYFATQEAEDVEAYLALWSRSVAAPQAGSLKSIFDSGDDRFTALEITRAAVSGDRARVRVTVRRQRSMPGRAAGDPPIVRAFPMNWALAYVKEGGAWKLTSEGPAEDDLAAALLEAASGEERESLLAREPALVNQALLTSLSRRGSGAAIAQAYREAQRIYEIVVAVARRTGARNIEGEALQNLANALYFQNRFPEALAAYGERLQIERARGDDLAAASALAGIGNIRYALAEYREALARYREALAIQERLDEQSGAAASLVSTGNVRYLQGDHAGAIRDYRRSRELNRAIFNTDGEARALEGLGRVYSAQGDYPAALEAFMGVLAEGRARADRGRQGLATQHIGDVHFRLGSLEAARAAFDESRGHFEAVNDLPNVGRVWQALGLTDLVAGRYEVAEQEYGRGISVCAGVEDQECTARARVGLAFAQSAQSKFEPAIASYRGAIAEFTALHRREDAARSEIGLSQSLAGHEDYAAALEAAGRARQAAVVLESDDVLWRALTAEARVLRRIGERDKALGVSRAAVSAIERLQRQVLDRPGASVPADAAAGLATFAVLQAESGDPAGALATAERLRALDLRASLANNEREIVRGMTADDRAEERRAAAELLTLQAQLSRERTLPKPDAARIAALEQRVAAATASRAAWLAGLFARLPELELWRGLAPVAAVEDLAPLLASGDLLLVATVVDEDDVLWLTASGGDAGVEVTAHLAQAARRTTAERVASLLQPAALRDAAAWRKASHGLFGAVPAAVVERMTAASTLVILPHEALWRVPFEAMPVGDGYLADRVRVVYASSLRALLRSAASPPLATGPLLAAAGPDLPKATRDRLAQTAPGWTLRPPDEAEREARAIAEVHEGRQPLVLARASASEAAWREHLARAGVLHVGAPFRVNGASPLFSPILLGGAGAGEAPADGMFEARELVNLELCATLAVVSDGAALSMRDGAGAVDVLHWTWLAAGVPVLLLPRWAVDPSASEALLVEFHRQVREGVAPGEALRKARAALRARAETAAPWYWAGWMLLGR